MQKSSSAKPKPATKEEKTSLKYSEAIVFRPTFLEILLQRLKTAVDLKTELPLHECVRNSTQGGRLHLSLEQWLGLLQKYEIDKFQTEACVIHWLFRNRLTGRLSYLSISRLINLARRTPAFCYSLREQVRTRHIGVVREELKQCLEKHNAESGKGLLTLRDFKIALEECHLQISESELKQLASRDILIRTDEVNYVLYRDYLDAVFGQNNFERAILAQAAFIVVRALKRGGHAKREMRSATLSKLKMSKVRAFEKKSVQRQQGEQTSMSLSRFAEKLLKLKEGVDSRHKISRKKASDRVVAAIVKEIVDSAFEFGESLLIQRSANEGQEVRPYLKDYLASWKEFQMKVGSILPRIFTITRLGRILLLSESFVLYQVDLNRKLMLSEVVLLNKTPYKKKTAIDFYFSEKHSRIFVLSNEWHLYAWDLNQIGTCPLSVIKLLQMSNTELFLQRAYRNTFGGTYPIYLSGSHSSGDLVLVNASALNRQIYVVDACMMALAYSVEINSDDFKMTNSMMQSLKFLLPKIKQLFINNVSFEKFLGPLASEIETDEEGENCVKSFVFVKALQMNFESTLRKAMKNKPTAYFKNLWREIVAFLDQNDDGTISKVEYRYIFTINNFLNSADSEQAYANLLGLSPECIALLREMRGIFTKNQEELNFFSKVDFKWVRNQLDKCDEHYSPAVLQELESFFADNSNEGTLEELELFCQYANVPELDKNAWYLSSKKNLMLCFKRCFQSNLNVAELIFQHDRNKEGELSASQFKAILSSLPIGLLPEEVQHHMQNNVEYTMRGWVDYRGLINEHSFELMLQRHIKRNQAQYHELQIMEGQKDFTIQGKDFRKFVFQQILMVEDLDLLIYTTIFPITSIVWVSRPVDSSSRFNAIAKASKLVYKLIGLKCKLPPSLAYVSSSGLLIAGDKFGPAEEDRVSGIYLFDLHPTQILCLKETEVKKPIRVIPNAHEDTILSVDYLSHSQLIVTTSSDKTLKLWNPAARSIKLLEKENQLRIKPGYYSSSTKQNSEKQISLRLVSKYLMKSVCYKVHCFSQIFGTYSVTQMVYKELFKKPLSNQNPYFVVENLVALQWDLLASETAGLKSSYLKGFSFQNLKIQIPTNRFEESIPQSLKLQLNEFGHERKCRKQANYHSFVSLNLEQLDTKVRRQQSQQNLVLALLKQYSISKALKIPFDSGQIQRVLRFLPSNQVSKEREDAVIDFRSMYVLLKKLNYLSPQSGTRNSFIQSMEIKEKRVKGKMYSSNDGSGSLITEIGKCIARGLDIRQLFENSPHPKVTSDAYDEKVISVTRMGFRKIIEKLNIPTTDGELSAWIKVFDPLERNEITHSSVQNYFVNEILNYKIREYFRSAELIYKIVSQKKGRERIQLAIELIRADEHATGYLDKHSFLQAFLGAAFDFDPEHVYYVFESYSEQLYGQKLISIAYIFSRLFTSGENQQLSLYFYMLASFKAGLLFLNKDPKSVFVSPCSQREFKRLFLEVTPRFEAGRVEAMTKFLASRKGSIDTEILLNIFKRCKIEDTLIALKYHKSISEEVSKFFEEVDIGVLSKTYGSSLVPAAVLSKYEFSAEVNILVENEFGGWRGHRLGDISQYLRHQSHRERITLNSLLSALSGEQLKSLNQFTAKWQNQLEPTLLLSYLKIVHKFRLPYLIQAMRDLCVVNAVYEPEELSAMDLSKSQDQLDPNYLLLKVVDALAARELNSFEIWLRHCDRREEPKLKMNNFESMLLAVECQVSKKQISDFYNKHLGADQFNSIETVRFKHQLTLAFKMLSVCYSERVWEHCHKLLDGKLPVPLLRAAVQVFKQNYTPSSNGTWPFVNALSFYNEVRKKLTFSEADLLLVCAYAVAGSSNNIKRAEQLWKLIVKSEMNLVSYSLNFSYFETAVDRLHAASQFKDEVKDSVWIGAFRRRVLEELQAKNFDVWLPLLQLNQVEKGFISMNQLKKFIGTLDLVMDIKQKLFIYKHFEEDNELIQIQKVGAFFSQSEEVSKARKNYNVLYKFYREIIYLGHTFNSLFYLFDKSHNGVIGAKEMRDTAKNLKAGQFQADVLIELFQLEGEVVTQDEFVQRLKALRDRFDLNPVREFKVYLLNKIKKYVEQKGRDLLECFLEIDVENFGSVTLDGIKKALSIFGISNIDNFHIEVVLSFIEGDLEGSPSQRFQYGRICERIGKAVLTLHEESIFRCVNRVQEFLQTNKLNLFECYHLFTKPNGFQMGRNQLFALCGQQTIWCFKDQNINFLTFVKFFQRGMVLDLESSEDLLRKFANCIHRLSDYDQVFRKFDKNNKGSVSLSEFKTKCRQYAFKFKSEQLQYIFKKILSEQEKKTPSDNPVEEQDSKSFNYQQFATLLARYRSEEASFMSKVKLKQLMKSVDFDSLFQAYNNSAKISTEEKPRLPLSSLKTIFQPYLKEKTICEIINCFTTRSVTVYKLQKLVEKNYDIPEWVYRGSNAPQMNFKSFASWLDEDDLKYSRLQKLRIWETLAKGEEFITGKSISAEIDNYRQDRGDSEGLTELAFNYDRIRTALHLKNIALILKKVGLHDRDQLSVQSLDRFLSSVGVVLKTEDIRQILGDLGQFKTGEVISVQDLVLFLISKKLYAPNAASCTVPMTCLRVLEVMRDTFEQLELSLPEAFRFFVKHDEKVIRKKNFLLLVQTLGSKLTKKELLEVYSYFDSENCGTINLESFVRLIERISENTVEEEKEDSRESVDQKRKIGKYFRALYYMIRGKEMTKKKFREMIDVHQNGFITLAQFYKVMNSVCVRVSSQTVTKLAGALDSAGLGLVRVSRLINSIWEYSLESEGEVHESRIQQIFEHVADPDKVDVDKLLKLLIKNEEKVTPRLDSFLTRHHAARKIGIPASRFLRIIKKTGIVLEEPEVEALRDFLMIRLNKEFIDLERTYELIALQLRKNRLNSRLDLQELQTLRQEQVLAFFEFIRADSTTPDQLFKIVKNKAENVAIEDSLRHFIEENVPEVTRADIVSAEFFAGSKKLDQEQFYEQFFKIYKTYLKGTYIDALISRLVFMSIYKTRILLSIFKSLKDYLRTFQNCWRFFLKQRVKSSEGEPETICKEDFSRALIIMGYSCSKLEIKYMYKFLDENDDDSLSYYEWNDFWMACEESLSNSGGFLADQLVCKNNLIETDIISIIGNYIRKKDVNIIELFYTYDSKRSGSLEKKEFQKYLKGLGIFLDGEANIQKLMAIIDAKGGSKQVGFIAFLSKIAKYKPFLFSNDSSTESEIYLYDRQLIELASRLKDTKHSPDNFKDHFASFDMDLDGCLEIDELARAVAGVLRGSSNFQIQKICHLIARRLGKYEVFAIGELCEYLTRVLNVTEQLINQNKIVPLSEETLHRQDILDILEEQDCIGRLSAQVLGLQNEIGSTEIESADIRINSRSFKLYSVQITSLKIMKELREVRKRFGLLCGTVKQAALRQVMNQVQNRLVDSKYTPMPSSHFTSESSQEMHAAALKHLDLSLFPSLEHRLNQAAFFERDDRITSIRITKGVLVTIPKLIASLQSQYGHVFERHLLNSLKLQLVLQPLSCYYPIRIKTGESEFSFLMAYDKFSEHEVADWHSKKSEASRRITTIKSLKSKNSEASDDREAERQFLGKFVPLKKLYKNIDGLLKMVNLVKSKLVPEIVHLIGNNLLRLMLECSQRGISGVLHRDNLMIDREVRFTVQSFIPHCQLNEFGTLSDGIELYLSYLYSCFQKDNMQTVVLDFASNFDKDAYIAPELRMRAGIANASRYMDVWMFGVHLFQLLFGSAALRFLQFPVPNEQFPKNFTLELYGKELFGEVLASYGIVFEEEYMVEAVQANSLAHAYIKQLISDEAAATELCDILDLVALCLEPEYFNRPNIDALLNSKVFSKKYNDNAKQLSSIIFMFESPAENTSKTVFEPLAELTELALGRRTALVSRSDCILGVIAEMTKIFKFTQREEPAKESNEEEVSHQLSPPSLNVIQQRRRPNNQKEIKLLFEDNTLDRLMLVVMRYQKLGQDHEKQLRRSKREGEQAQKLRKELMEVLERTASMMECLLGGLKDYDNPLSVYVGKILDNLVKFLIGEDGKFLSSRNGPMGSEPRRRYMLLQEFQGQESQQDQESVKIYWTEMLYTYAGPLYKHTIMNASLVVLQDHISSCTKKHDIHEFDLKEKIARLNEEIEGGLPVTALYYNDLMSLGESLKILLSCLGSDSERSTKSTKKIMFSFLKSVLKSCRTDKIKAFLDIKVVYYLIPYLFHPDHNLRRDLLEIFLEISKAFLESEDCLEKRSTESLTIDLGIIQHFIVTQQKISRESFAEYCNEYVVLRRKINRFYMLKIGRVFKSALLRFQLSSLLGGQTNLDNLLIILNILENIMQDVRIQSEFYGLMFSKLGASPAIDMALLRIYHKIYDTIDQRTSSIIVTQPAFLKFCKEKELEVPMRLGMWQISSLFQRLRKFFAAKQADMAAQIEDMLERRPEERIPLKLTPRFLKLYEDYLVKCSSVVMKGDFQKEIETDGLKPTVGIIFILEETIDFIRLVVDNLLRYGQLCYSVEQVVLFSTKFIWKVTVKGWDKIFMFKGTEFMRWLLTILEQICLQDCEGKLVHLYMSNRLLAAGHYIQKTLMIMVNKYTDAVLIEVQFARYFLKLVKMQFVLLQKFIRSHIEDVQVIETYARDCSWRLRVWEALLTRGKTVLQEILNSSFLESLCSSYLNNFLRFDLSSHRSRLDFLPYRDTTPIRSEALAMITCVMWRRETAPEVYEALLVQIYKAEVLSREAAIVRRRELKSMPFIGALFFFSVMFNSGESQMIFTMKHNHIPELLRALFKDKPALKEYCPALVEAIESL